MVPIFFGHPVEDATRLWHSDVVGSKDAECSVRMTSLAGDSAAGKTGRTDRDQLLTMITSVCSNSVNATALSVGEPASQNF